MNNLQREKNEYILITTQAVKLKTFHITSLVQYLLLPDMLFLQDVDLVTQVGVVPEASKKRPVT